MNKEQLIETWKQEEARPFSGWDFSYLEGRMIEDQTPWSYTARAAELMRRSTVVLDMGTGGGERLLKLKDSWPNQVVVTEDYPPNVRLAKQRLEPLGVKVVETPLTREGSMPFADGEFDLILNRHSGLNPAEVTRVLAPGGVFLTQQIHGLWAQDMLAAFGVTPQWPDATPAYYMAGFEDAGLSNLNLREWQGSLVFTDVGAVVYYLKAVPWLVPGFSVQTHLQSLLCLQERLEETGRLVFEARKYLIEAKKSQVADQTPGLAAHRSQRPGAERDPRLSWFRQARFGMFIHWGLYAIPAGIWQGQETDYIGEWIMHSFQIPVREYEPLATQFNPVKFDAKAWVSLAKAAGQKYIIFTAKHHDGFCLFKTGYTPYNIVDATPFGRDVCKELADECARQGLTLCFYYSQTQDWHEPGSYGNTWDFTFNEQAFAEYIEKLVKPQVTELLTNYGPIGTIWFDTPYYITEQQSVELTELVHRLQPDTLVCGRIGNRMGDYASAGDNAIPDKAVDGDFEAPATINDTWGYKVNDHNWKSVREMLHKLVDVVSKNGNYLLNVGPTAEGEIPPESVERLLAMGEWLRVNGESIYGCGAGPLQGVAGLRSTQKPGVVYLHLLDLSSDGALVVEGIPGVQTASLLASGEPLRFEQQAGRLGLHLPQSGLDPWDTVVKLVLAQGKNAE